MKVKPFHSDGQLSGYTFWCPGCQMRHQVSTAWSFNGDLEHPTFQPSVLVRSGHYARTPPVMGECYCDWNERYPDKEPLAMYCVRCHSFVTNGKIQFLPDCSHALAGQTVDLPDFPVRSDL